MLNRRSPTYRVDFTCTRHNRRPESTIKSYRSLSPQGFATFRPRPVALFKNAASACFPQPLPRAGRSPDFPNPPVVIANRKYRNPQPFFTSHSHLNIPILSAIVIPSVVVILSKAKDLCTFAAGGAQNPHNKKAQPEGYAIKSIIT